MNNIKYYYIALAAVLTLGFSACTDEVEYQGASPVAENCIRASFTSDGDNYTVASNVQTITGITVVRENTTDEVTVPLKTLPQSADNFQIPASVTFAAGSATATFDIPFSGLEPEEFYTFSVALDNSAVDSYSESVLASTTGYVLQQANWNQELGTATPNFMYYGTDSNLWGYNVTTECTVLGTSEYATWYKLVGPIEQGNDLVLKVDENNTVRVREQLLYMADISNLLGYSYPPVECYVSLNSSYTGQLVGVNIDGQVVGFPANTYDPESRRIAVVLDYTCVAGTITTAVTSFVAP